ncbi:FAD-binding oxidoreductase [Clostridium sp. PL3]|uniref:FAD-binding oxidoreductase n=1 Tax=Clostridium thailandense TaxID=2794346 RepID=A0A949TV90_9CLOT|nr:FAD-dependent oxidoreductase [Clostridium thailandense]MBV7272065.1 FAD-binding oxidoreductase [Clostridium thailandense]
MNLQSGKFYWPTTLLEVPSYPSLEEDIDCDVLIIGCGTSGAQCAYYLVNSGANVILVDKRRAGFGSTSTNTALIQYMGEKMFFELINSFGEDYAARHLNLCKKAIDEIENICNSLSLDSEFCRRDTLYYQSYEEDYEKIIKEFNFLKKHGFDVELLDEETIEKLYSFKKHSAIYSKNDAELNPYKFTISLLEKCKSLGARIFENTEINGKKFEKDYAVFFTKGNHSIKAKHVIIAAGYECLEIKNEKNTVLSSSYAVVTNQIKDFGTWYKRTLIWESARPYIYMRTTADNRIIIGGLDENITIPQKRDSKLLHNKEKLITEFNKLFPDINVYPEFYISAFYGGTHDGLPIIGKYEELPNCYVLYGYGDNGTVYSMVLSKIISDLIQNKPNEDINLYLQNRPLLINK